MKWQGMLNEYELVYCWFPKTIMKFEGKFWFPSGKARGILVKMTCWHGDVWYVLPEDLLVAKS